MFAPNFTFLASSHLNIDKKKVFNLYKGQFLDFYTDRDPFQKIYIILFLFAATRIVKLKCKKIHVQNDKLFLL